MWREANWYSLMPLVVILTVVCLALPWLGLIALMLVAVVALAAFGALAWGIASVPLVIIRSVSEARTAEVTQSGSRHSSQRPRG